MKRPTHYQIVERSIYLADGMAPKCALKAICAIIEFFGSPTVENYHTSERLQDHKIFIFAPYKEG